MLHPPQIAAASLLACRLDATLITPSSLPHLASVLPHPRAFGALADKVYDECEQNEFAEGC
jgi:hypothetical protein